LSGKEFQEDGAATANARLAKLYCASAWLKLLLQFILAYEFQASADNIGYYLLLVK